MYGMVCDMHFVVDGFSDEQEILFVVALDNESASQLSSDLRQPDRRQLWEWMRETPLLANMVAELAKDQESLPQTMTENYMTVTKNTMQHFAAKHGVEGVKDLSRPLCKWPVGLKEPPTELSKAGTEWTGKEPVCV